RGSARRAGAGSFRVQPAPVDQAGGRRRQHRHPAEPGSPLPGTAAVTPSAASRRDRISRGRIECVASATTQNPNGNVGGGLAGGNAAATLREEGFRGPVVLISREPGVPFGRPPLSKTYLRSEEDLGDWYVRPPGWYAAHDVELRREAVVAVD